MRKRRVIFIAGANFDVFGGVERVAILLAEKLPRDKYEVRVVISRANYVKHEELISNSLDENQIFFHEAGYNFAGCYKLVRCISSLDSDAIILGFWYSCNTFFSLLSLFSKIKFVAVEHCDYFNPPLKWRVLRKLLYKFNSGVVCLTNKDKIIFSKFHKRAVLIRNPMSNTKDYSLQTTNKLHRFVYVGHLRKLKRVDDIIKAVFKSSAKMRELGWKLDIVGDGPEKEKLQRLTRNLNIQDIVKFHGYSNTPEYFYRRSRYLILASDTECLPMVIIESRQYDVIPISSRYSTAVNELITDEENGYLFNIGDTNELSNIINSAMELTVDKYDNMLSLGKDSTEEFSVSTVMNKWGELLDV